MKGFGRGIIPHFSTMADDVPIGTEMDDENIGDETLDNNNTTNSNNVPVQTDEIDNKNGFSRIYKFKNLPPPSIDAYLKEKFPSLDVCCLTKVKSSNVFYPVLTCIFKDNTDWIAAESFDIKIGERTIKITDCSSYNKTETSGPGIFPIRFFLSEFFLSDFFLLESVVFY